MDEDAGITYDSVVAGIMLHNHPIVGYTTGVLYRNLLSKICPEIAAMVNSG